jgi:N-acetylmuramic acid 6-phosphate etherase
MFVKITELPSPYHNLERMPLPEILRHINDEDRTVAEAVSRSVPEISRLSEAAVDKMLSGGRLFYIGAGTSGRLAIVDASECPPTFGVESDLVVGIIAGGDSAIRKSVEFAEDDESRGWSDLQQYKVSSKDFVVGIAASGTTPYVVGALEKCQRNGILTGCITCNPGAPITGSSDFPVAVAVGPEFITGSTRMKSGTAQKLILNMISTSIMIKLGRVEDNKMVNVQLSNNKLIDRGVRMVMDITGAKDYDFIKSLLLDLESVKKVVSFIEREKAGRS